MNHLIETTIKGVSLQFRTQYGVFSASNIDKGTLAMLSLVDFELGDKVLDLGCGYGVVGVLAAKLIGPQNVVMIDKDSLAVNLARENAVRNGVAEVLVCQSDGFSQFSETGFTKILSNPPYHTDFSVAKGFIEKGFNRLGLNGKMYMVTKRKDWYKNKFISIFGGVRVEEVDGYYVFCAEKRSNEYAKKRKSKKASMVTGDQV